MANLERLGEILKNASLDRETKLMIIDILSLSDDKQLEEDLIQLVLDWHDADQAVINLLLEKFDAIKEKYDQEKISVAAQSRKDVLVLADDVNREQKIQQIREHIETL